MKRLFVKQLVLPLASIVLISCDSGQGTSLAPTTELAPIELEDEQQIVLTKYDGNYQSFCGLSAFSALSEASVTVTTIDGDTGSITIFNYDDARCAVPATHSRTDMEISIRYTGDTIDTRRGTADFIDITVESVLLDGRAPSLAEQQLLAESTNLSTRYDIILLQDSALYTGETTEAYDGHSSETRPITLSPHVSIEQ